MSVQNDIEGAGGMLLSKWVATLGLSARTARRWRKDGKITVVWRYGRAFVTASFIKSFFVEDETNPAHTRDEKNIDSVFDTGGFTG